MLSACPPWQSDWDFEAWLGKRDERNEEGKKKVLGQVKILEKSGIKAHVKLLVENDGDVV